MIHIGVGLVHHVLLEPDAVPEHVPRFAIDRQAEHRSEGVRRNGREQPPDGITVIVVMCRFDHHHVESALCTAHRPYPLLAAVRRADQLKSSTSAPGHSGSHVSPRFGPYRHAADGLTISSFSVNVAPPRTLRSVYLAMWPRDHTQLCRPPDHRPRAAGLYLFAAFRTRGVIHRACSHIVLVISALFA